MKHLFLALTNPVPGREADYNAWYDKVHLREIVDYSHGMLGARRFKLSDDQRPGQEPAPWGYVAAYDMEVDDVAAYFAKPLKDDAPTLEPFTGIIAEDFTGWLYTPIGPRYSRPGVASQRLPGEGFLFFALTNAAEGREDDFNAWYDDYHLREVVERIPCFMAGQRYRLADEQHSRWPRSPWKYLAIYEVQAESAAAIHAAAAGALKGAQPAGGSLDPHHIAWVFESIGPYYGAQPATTAQS